MAMEAGAMPGGTVPPSPLPPPARPLPSPRTASRKANTAPPQIPLHESTPPVGSGITPMTRTDGDLEQGGLEDGDLEKEQPAGLVRVKLEAASDVPRSRPPSKKKGKKQITGETRVEQQEGSKVPISATVRGKRSLSHPSENSRARKAARTINAKSKFLFEMANEKETYKQIGEDDEEEEYVLLELDDCLYSSIQPNAPYILSGLDTLTPTLIVGGGLKMIGEYEETVGTCYLFSESDAPPKPVRDGSAPRKENKDKQASNSKESSAPSKEVKHLASVQKILKFRSASEDHQEHRGYLHEDK